jgi:hypothetical protein
MKTIAERRKADQAAGQNAREWLDQTTRGGPKGNTPRRGSTPPTDLEVKVREFLSSQNRHERRDWLNRQSLEAGKIRRWIMTQTKKAK